VATMQIFEVMSLSVLM